MSKPFKDITGQKFGKLTTLYRLHNTKSPTKWLCICDCGNLTETHLSSLKNGNTKSCGCLYKINHVKTHGKSHTRLYTINGETHCLSEWCEILNLNYWTIHKRVNELGYNIEKALFTPIKRSE